MEKLVKDPRTWEKFKPNGTALTHPGSSMLAAVKENSHLQELGMRIQQDVVQRGWGRDFALTIPSSFHMTVFETLKMRTLLGQAEKWPAWLDGAEDFPSAVMQMRQKLIDAHISAPRDLEMKAVGVFPLHERLTIRLDAANPAVHAELGRFRAQVSETLELPVASLDQYHFHTTLGYRLTACSPGVPELGEAEALYDSWVADLDSVDLERVSYCIFNDMQSFSPVLFFD